MKFFHVDPFARMCLPPLVIAENAATLALNDTERVGAREVKTRVAKHCFSKKNKNFHDPRDVRLKRPSLEKF